MELITAYKCGEIYRNSMGEFMFSCQFCTDVFTSTKAILDHIEVHLGIKCADDLLANSVNDVESDGIYSADDKDFNETGDDNSSLDDYEIHNTDYDDFFWPMIPDIFYVNNDDDDDDFFWPIVDEGNNSTLKNSTEDFSSIAETTNQPHSTKNTKSSTDFVWPLVPLQQATPKKQKSVTEILVPSGKRPIACTVCGKIVLKDSFQNHMAMHFGEPKYICEICDKKFKVKKSLRTHMTTHSKYQPKRKMRKNAYMCHHCGLTFTSNQSLVFHMNAHTDEKNEKKFKCEECDLAWSTPGTYYAHVRLHKAYDKNSGIPFDKHFSCKICNRKYLDWNSFLQHERMHTGEKKYKYKCEICQQSFGRLFTYKEHIILHSNEKPYQCRYCDKDFAQRATCYSHEKFVHRKMPRKKAKQLKDPIQSNNTIALPSASTASMANYSEQPSTLPSTQNEPEIVYKSEEVLTIFDDYNMTDLE